MQVFEAEDNPSGITNPLRFLQIFNYQLKKGGKRSLRRAEIEIIAQILRRPVEKELLSPLLRPVVADDGTLTYYTQTSYVLDRFGMDAFVLGTERKRMRMPKHAHCVLSASMSADGSVIYTCCSYGFLYIWDTATGCEFVDAQLNGYFLSHVKTYGSGDVALLASGNGGLIKYQRHIGHCYLGYRGKELCDMALTSCGKTLATGGADGLLSVYDISSTFYNACKLTLENMLDGPVTSVDFGEAAGVVAAGCKAGYVSIFSLRSGAKIRHIAGFTSSFLQVCLSADASVVGVRTREAVQFFVRGEAGAAYEFESERVAVSPNGRFFALTKTENNRRFIYCYDTLTRSVHKM